MNTPGFTEINLELIQTIEWRRFEVLCREYFKANGHDVTETKTGKDGGIDLYLFPKEVEQHEPASRKPSACVQCKSWQTQNVGVRVIRELFGVMSSENIENGYLLSAGGFTDDALSFAKGKNIRLIDGHELVELIQQLPHEDQQSIFLEITKGDYTTPTCPSCDTKMVRRKKKQPVAGESPTFWGCRNYPKCRYTMKERNGPDERTPTATSPFQVTFMEKTKTDHSKSVILTHKHLRALQIVLPVILIISLFFLSRQMLSSIADQNMANIQKQKEVIALIRQKELDKKNKFPKNNENTINHSNAQNEQSTEEKNGQLQEAQRQQELEEFRRLQIEAEKQEKLRELSVRFEREYNPEPDCINPSEAMFAKCVNARKNARSSFFEAAGHPLDQNP